MKWLLAVSVILAACGPNIPEPDVCDEGATSPASEVQIGQGDLDSVFTPWATETEVELVFGPQGGAMLPFRIQLEAEAGCLVTSMKLVVPASTEPPTEDVVVASYQGPLRYYQQPNDSWLSATHYLVLNSEFENTSQATLEVEVGGSSYSSVVRMTR